MRKQRSLKSVIMLDCLKANFPSILIYIVGGAASSLLTVYAASLLGGFADSLFKLDFQNGLITFWRLLISVLINIIIIPLINIGGEITMFSNALNHDRYVIGRFIDKTYEDAMSINVGEAQSRLENDPTCLRCDLVEVIVRSVLTPLTFVYLLYNTLSISWFFTIVTLFISMIKFVVPITIKQAQAKFDLENKVYSTAVRSCETEFTQQPHMIKILGLTESMIEKLDSLFYNHYYTIIRKSARYSIISENALSFLDVICSVAIVLIGSIMISNNSISPGSVVAMLGYSAVFNTVINDIDYFIRRFPIINNEVDRLKVLYRESENLYGETIINTASIELDNVSFSYGEDTIFNNVSFKIDRGEKVAIAGANGSGKSTLIMVLAGLLKNYQGNIRINGKELSQLSSKIWREQFAFVTQDPYLFEGSVFENIKLGKLKASDAEVLSVMKKLDILYLADKVVPFNATSLSGGEKQRISIARAILKGAAVLIFDEPNNNLDVTTVKVIKNYMSKCLKTVIFVSHDEEFNKIADRIINIDQFC